MKEYYKLFPSIWEGYEAGELLGSGSFGDVYTLKKKGSLEAPVEAFKEVAVPPASAGGLDEALFQGLDIEGAKYYYEGMKQKALEEAEIMKRFSDCPNIVQFKDYQVKELPEDYNEYGWIIFVRMELLQPFKDKLFQDGITIREVARLIIDLCTALEACHAQGILHRDIKPENIFYSPISRTFKLGDFGIACYMTRLTEEKGLPGTLTHMAPEVYRGNSFDYESDLYAVGMILYKLLNDNRVPFLPDYPEKYSPIMRNQAIRRRLEGEEIQMPSIVRKSINASPLAVKVGDVSDEAVQNLASIAKKAIASERQNRYVSATDLKQALIMWESSFYN
ncbi:MAG: serine/threonine protein kinase [Tyzzerella sp.]|nr:serine/threonine protein kinase [Tyzzerella sp.]